MQYCRIVNISGNPKEFMIGQLVQLKNAKTMKEGYPCLFDDGNIEAMFRLMDPEGCGFISAAQFAEGQARLFQNDSITCHNTILHLYHHSHVISVLSLPVLVKQLNPVHCIQLLFVSY